MKEDRLLDLAADGSLTTNRVRERLNKIQVQRATLTQRLTATEDYIRQESNMLLDYLDLLEKPGSFYAAAHDDVKRKLLYAYFSQIWVDDDGHRVVTDAQPQMLVARIKHSAGKIGTNQKGTELLLGASDYPDLASYFKDAGSSKDDVVHTVDMTSSKYRHMPPTAFQLARLAKNSRSVKPEAAPWVDDEIVARDLRRRLGPKVISELVSKYNAGVHTPALAQEHGISTTGLRQLLIKEGVKFRGQSITPEDSDRAVKLYESGLTIREVVTEIGYSLGTIRRELHRRGVPMRPSGRWNHLPPKLRY